MRLLTRALSRARTPLWRLFVSYLLVLIIPTGTVFIVYSTLFFRDYSRYLRVESDNNLRNMGAYVEDQMSRLFSTVAFASANPAMSSRLSFADIPALRQAQKVLSEYKSGQAYIDDIGVYLPAEGRLLTATTIISAENLPFSARGLPEELRRANGSPLLLSAESSRYFLPPEGLRCVLLAFPYPLDALARSDSFILVALNLDTLRYTLERYFPAAGSSAGIFGKSGLLVAASGNSAALEASAARQAGALSAGVTADRNGRHLSTLSAATSLFDYCSIVSEAQILRPVIGLQRTFVVLAVLVMLAGFVGVYAFMVVNYNPIRDLRRLIEQRLDAHSDETDELLAIERVVEEHSDGFDRLKQASQAAAREHIVTRLVQGQVRTLEELREPGADALHSPGCYQAVVVALDPPPAGIAAAGTDDGLGEMAGGLIDGLSRAGMRAVYKADERDGRSLLILIVSAPDSVDEEALMTELRTAGERVSARRGSTVSIGVGESCRTPDLAGRSYLEAQACLDYTLVKGRGEIVLWKELPRGPRREDWNLLGPLSDLGIAMREGDGEAVERMVGGIVDRIRAERCPLFIARCMCYDLINAVIHIAHDCGMSLTESPGGYPIQRLEGFRTIDELSARVREFSTELRAGLAGSRAPSRLGVDARAYIQAHYAEPDFYIQGLCASLGVSPSLLSQAFRAAYGMTMSDYISRLRIEEAQRLLRTTALPVDAIIQRVGYTDRSSFTRKFRTRVGTSPGAYRRQAAAAGPA